MKFIQLLSVFFTVSVMAQNVSVVVDGTTYQCSGSGGGGGGSSVNLCRCRLVQYSQTDYDYVLEKYNPTNSSYTLIQNFNQTDSTQGSQDKANCDNAKSDPACYFTQGQLNLSRPSEFVE